jgi:type I restriction enzyme S subunit
MKFGVEDHIIEEITRVLQEYPKVDKAYIFGSRAMGNYRLDSDIDIAIKGYDLTVEEVLKMSTAIDKAKIGYEVDLVDYNSIKEEELKKHVDRVGIEFYSRWKDYNLDEVYEFGSGLSKSADQFGYGYGFLSFKDVFDNYFVPDELTSLVNSTDKEQESCSIKYGDVFLTRTSETDEDLGMSCVALKDYPKATFNGFTKRLRTNGKIDILPEYAGFYFRSPKFRATVSSMSSVTTRASLNNGMLSQLTITTPPLSEQKGIADILISLNKKIDFLRRQNKALESVAESLFRQWFIIEAKEAWTEIELKDLALHWKEHISPSKRPKEIYYHYSLPAFDNGKIPAIETGEEILSNKYKVIPNSLLVSKLNPRFPRIWGIFGNSIHRNSVCSTEFQVLKPKESIYLVFLYFFLKSSQIIRELSSSAGGTSGSHQRVSPEDIFGLKLLLPPSEKIRHFDIITRVQFDKIAKNIDQTKGLTHLRDILLPKLLSGEARVNPS